MVEKNFESEKKSWSIFFSDSKKNVGRKKKVDRKKKLVEFFFESEKCWSKILLVGRKKKVEKIDNFVNFGVSLTFFVVDHSGRPGPKRVSTVIPNSILLVDSRETNGEKCGQASREVQFLSSRLHPAEI